MYVSIDRVLHGWYLLTVPSKVRVCTVEVRLRSLADGSFMDLVEAYMPNRDDTQDNVDERGRHAPRTTRS